MATQLAPNRGPDAAASRPAAGQVPEAPLRTQPLPSPARLAAPLPSPGPTPAAAAGARMRRRETARGAARMDPTWRRRA